MCKDNKTIKINYIILSLAWVCLQSCAFVIYVLYLYKTKHLGINAHFILTNKCNFWNIVITSFFYNTSAFKLLEHTIMLRLYFFYKTYFIKNNQICFVHSFSI